MIMNRATPGPSIGRGTFEEGGRTKEEGEMIRGMWSEECGVRIPQISVARWREKCYSANDLAYAEKEARQGFDALSVP